MKSANRRRKFADDDIAYPWTKRSALGRQRRAGCLAVWMWADEFVQLHPITERTTSDGTTICELEVRNKSLNEVCLSLSDKLDRPIRLGPNVDPDRNIQNIRIETNDWLGVLKGVAVGMGHLLVTVDEEEIRLNAE